MAILSSLSLQNEDSSSLPTQGYLRGEDRSRNFGPPQEKSHFRQISTVTVLTHMGLLQEKQQCNQAETFTVLY